MRELIMRYLFQLNYKQAAMSWVLHNIDGNIKPLHHWEMQVCLGHNFRLIEFLMPSSDCSIEIQHYVPNCIHHLSWISTLI